MAFGLLLNMKVYFRISGNGAHYVINSVHFSVRWFRDAWVELIRCGLFSWAGKLYGESDYIVIGRNWTCNFQCILKCICVLVTLRIGRLIIMLLLCIAFICSGRICMLIKLYPLIWLKNIK